MQDIFGLDQRKSASKWQAAAFQLGLVLSAGGLLVMLLTYLKSFGAAELLGQVLGMLLFGAGVTSVLGSKARNTHMVIASLTLALVGMLLAFEFVAEVNREAKVDCALAELYTRSLATERMLEQQKQAEVITKLYVRMNEMDDMISGIQTGAVKRLQLNQAQDALKHGDHGYIQAKMRTLKLHADNLLDTILNHPNMTESQIYQLSAHEKDDLRSRVKAADDVIDKVIHKYEEGHDGSEVFEEYENGLQALLNAYSAGSPADHFQLPQQDSSKLVQAASEVHHMQAALTRATEDSYHKLDPAGQGKELQELQEHRVRRQQDFTNQFLATLHQHEMVKHSNFLQNLPEHCVVENKNEKVMVSLGLTVMMLELSAVYCTLSYVLCMPRKRD